MLFVLIGDIQTGKTRWLCDVVDQVTRAGVTPFGVVAPGVWREPARGNDLVRVYGGFACAEVAAIDWDAMPSGPVDDGGYEKMGICNVLLPGRETVLLALRRDVAAACGRLREGSQSERASLGWCMSDAAISQVDEHFRAALPQWVATGSNVSRGVNERVSPDFDNEEEALPGSDPENAPDAGSVQVALSPESEAGCEASRGAEKLLVVDELGRLELVRGEGLVSAMELLRQGPTPACPHALVVARTSLADRAEFAFADLWGGSLCIYPDEDGAGALIGALKAKN